MSLIKYIEGKNELLPQAIKLREKLLVHHKNLKHHFAEDFINKINNNNEQSILLEKNFIDTKVIIVKDRSLNKDIGFCLGGINKENIGEIDTIYVDPEYQKFKIGTELMNIILKWMDEKKVISKELSVCAGNESVFDFYKKFNFYPRKTLLKQIK